MAIDVKGEARSGRLTLDDRDLEVMVKTIVEKLISLPKCVGFVVTVSGRSKVRMNRARTVKIQLKVGGNV